jgi:hypothetical protein
MTWTPERLAAKRAEYQRRRLANQCAWCPCDSAPGATLCEACGKAVREQRKRRREARAALRAPRPVKPVKVRRPETVKADRELAAYRPLDEILSSPTVRILRALRWFDWVEMADLLDALDESDDLSAARIRVTMNYLVHTGRVESTGRGKGTRHRYRITQAGRGELARQLKRAA